MTIEERYHEQVRLLVRVLPIVAGEPVFALKGGTAINLFIRDLPRLSVDIDLAYLPISPREEALADCAAALDRMGAQIQQRLGVVVRRQANRADELRMFVSNGRCRIKIEVSPVLRGSVYPPEVRDVVAAVEDEYGFASIPVVSVPDLYGGKLCAALDRQHPRDWFDVMQLLDSGELDRTVFLGFLVYLLGHARPINEVLSPRWKSLSEPYQREFRGMLREPIPLMALVHTRERLMTVLGEQLTDEDIEFLLSFKLGHPRWELLPLKGIAELPAVRWKLRNIQKMPAQKQGLAYQKLETALSKLRAGEFPEPIED